MAGARQGRCTARVEYKGSDMTDKELYLRIMMLLSALESWSFADNHRLPDYLIEELNEVIETLRKEVLK